MALENMQFFSPVGDLEWAVIDGPGKADPNGNMKYTIDVVLDDDDVEAVTAQITKFWEDNKASIKGKEPNTLGFFPHKVKDVKASEAEGENVYVETGRTVLRFKTNVTYASGDPKVVKVFNAKGAEISLMGKKIGPGSRGRVNGVLSLYDSGPTSRGCTLYLNGVQLTKFEELTTGVTFDEAEGDFEGVSDMGGVPFEEVAKPRL